MRSNARERSKKSILFSGGQTMQRESIERLIRAVVDNYYSAKVAAALVLEQKYEEVFKIVPSSACYNPERWDTIAQIHQMVVAWRPAVAHEWLEIATQPLFAEQMSCAYAYVKGSLLGLLKAGTWLDENWKESTKFQEQLLLKLAEVLCGPMKLQIHPWNLEVDSYGERITEAVRTYVFPQKNVIGRAEQLERMVAYIRQNGDDKKFSPLDHFMLEQLCHGILAQRPATQKIAAVHFLLSSYGAEVNNEPDLSFC